MSSFPDNPLWNAWPPSLPLQGIGKGRKKYEVRQSFPSTPEAAKFPSIHCHGNCQVLCPGLGRSWSPCPVYGQAWQLPYGRYVLCEATVYRLAPGLCEKAMLSCTRWISGGHKIIAKDEIRVVKLEARANPEGQAGCLH